MQLVFDNKQTSIITIINQINYVICRKMNFKSKNID